MVTTPPSAAAADDDDNDDDDVPPAQRMPCNAMQPFDPFPLHSQQAKRQMPKDCCLCQYTKTKGTKTFFNPCRARWLGQFTTGALYKHPPHTVNPSTKVLHQAAKLYYVLYAMSTIPTDSNVPSNDIAQNSAVPSMPTQAPNSGPKKSMLMGVSASTEQAKKEAKKKVNMDKTTLTAKLSRKAAEKKKAKVTTNLHGLKDSLHDLDNILLPSDMEISDEEASPLELASKNRYEPLQDPPSQTTEHADSMITDETVDSMVTDNTAKEPTPPQHRAPLPRRPFFPLAPVTPMRDTACPSMGEEITTPGGEAPELDSFIRRHAQSLNFSSPPNSSPFLKTAARVGLIVPNCAAYVAPMPEHTGDGVQELFLLLPTASGPQDAFHASTLPPASTAAPPTSESDTRLLN
ncbi:hypothetical protein EWM64_g8370 [Hericium alpestre]|uniref:Uncharacterized protein n=1 Tax=Hericium alpestre TaxID=135208 RepID=A0A4Y9ZP82_9AGAM|nr:hypothetical protein EWM64_g8370 [Hericium alpestre]